MVRGEQTLMPNWAIRAARELKGAEGWVLLALAERSQYRESALNLGDLMSATGYGERAVQKALHRLRDLGHVVSVGGLHCLFRAACPVRSAPAKIRAAGEPQCVQGEPQFTRAAPEHPKPQPDTHGVRTTIHPKQTENVFPDEEKRPLKYKEVKEEKREIPGEVEAREDRPANPAHQALVFFEHLCGYGFAISHNPHLTRWWDTYTPEFLTLAWRLAPAAPGSHGRAQWVFVDWLNRHPNKPWPDELTLAYKRLCLPLHTAGETVPDAAPRLGAEVRLGRRVGRVVAVNADRCEADIQIGPDAAHIVTAPWASVVAA